MNARPYKLGLGAALLVVALFAQVAFAQKALRGHTDDVWFVAFLPDGKTIMSGAEDFTIRLWDAMEGRELKIWQAVPKFDPAPSTKILSPVSYTHLRAHETPEHLVCRLL